jgi:predicted RNA-binding Zn-ribbon protein involved in translation (DUF1610 family)
MDLTGIFVLAALLGIIPATIAAKKGHNFFAWWFFGAAMFIVALPAAIVVGERSKKAQLVHVNPRLAAKYASKEAIDSWNAAFAAANEPETKDCPQCAEAVRFRAKVCRFCGYDFTAPSQASR